MHIWGWQFFSLMVTHRGSTYLLSTYGMNMLGHILILVTVTNDCDFHEQAAKNVGVRLQQCTDGLHTDFCMEIFCMQEFITSELALRGAKLLVFAKL